MAFSKTETQSTTKAKHKKQLTLTQTVHYEMVSEIRWFKVGTRNVSKQKCLDYIEK